MRPKVGLHITEYKVSMLLQSAVSANRAGRLVDSQRALLERRIRSLRWTYFSIAVLFLTIAGALGLGLYSEIPEWLPYILGGFGFFVLLLLPLFWRMRIEIRKVRDDLAAGRVQAQTGAVTLGYKGGSLIVGGQWFPRPRSVRGIEWNVVYTVYYAPRSRVIIAMEKTETR